MKIGFLGPEGTFTEYSALLYTDNFKNYEKRPYRTIHESLLGVESGEVDEAIVPFENSIEGTVTISVDTLIFDVNLFIKAEVVIPVSQNFMVRSEFDDQHKISKILSHPQGLAQCEKFVREHYAESEIQSTTSTSEAAKMVAESKECWAAIAPSHAAEVYGLNIRHAEIQDKEHNETRFLVVTKKEQPLKKENVKTSIIFSTEEKPGGLYKILDILAIWDLNMTKIESRPSKSKLGTYVFFVDLQTENSKDMEDALKMVQRKSTFFKHLGSYPVFKRS